MTDPATFWNSRFSAADYIYGTEPNAWLRAQAFRLRPGMRVLAVADGEGRNGVWLAEQGCDVTSVDASEVGLAKAQALAAQRNVRLTTTLADLTEYAWDAGPFDAVVAIFAHFPPHHRPRIHQNIARALAPGGLLILEAFHHRQLGRASGGPKDPTMLYDERMLKSDFHELELLELLEGTVFLNEGRHHSGAGEVIRLLASRPAE